MADSKKKKKRQRKRQRRNSDVSSNHPVKKQSRRISTVKSEGRVLPKEVIIVGGGIVGACTAYYLSKLGGGKVKITILERENIACAASGKAAGFLQKDWAEGEFDNLQGKAHAGGLLNELSFRLHHELAQELGPESIQFRSLETYSTYPFPGKEQNPSKDAHELKSFYNPATWYRVGSKRTTAQVHPKWLTKKLVEVSGAKVQKSRVIGIKKSKSRRNEISPTETITSLKLEGGGSVAITEEHLVCFCIGPWSSELRKWGLNAPRIVGMKSHGMLLRRRSHGETKEGQTPMLCPQAVAFVECPNLSAEYSILEVYPRPDGDIFVNGRAERTRVVSQNPTAVKPSKGVQAEILEVFDAVAPKFLPLFPGKQNAGENNIGKGHAHRMYEIASLTACHYPMPPDEMPVIGKMSDCANAYICSGHMYWGITNGPASGYVIAQLMLGLEPSIDISVYSPERFLPKTRRRHRKG